MSCCAIIVTFHPGAEITENIAALRGQVDEIIIVDNGSGDGSRELLGQLAQLSGVSIIYNQENLGIAAALNMGVRLAKAAGHQWIMTFDQDSKVTPGMIGVMLDAYEAYPEKEKVASMSPRYRHKQTGKVYGNSPDSPDKEVLPYAEVLMVMTSGNLIRSSIFDVVGYFNEALFIDYVDNEFCLRCSVHGYRILEVKDAFLEHSIGYPTQHKLLWKTPISSNHSALRRYYIARNSIYTYRKFMFTHPMWVLKDAYGLLKVLTVLVLFEADRKQKLAAIIRGVIHGLSGRMGKFSGPSQASGRLPNIPRN